MYFCGLLICFIGAIEHWDVSSVEGFIRMFSEAISFNQPLDNWDMSSATKLDNMFYYTSYNQPLGSWDTALVRNMGNTHDHTNICLISFLYLMSTLLTYAQINYFRAIFKIQASVLSIRSFSSYHVYINVCLCIYLSMFGNILCRT